MADISIKLFGKSIPNPVMPAAGPNCVDGKMLVEVAAAGVGALVMKTISTVPAKVPYPNIISAGNNTLLNSELWAELPAEQYIDVEYKLAKSTGKYLMASVGYTEADLRELGSRIEATGMVDSIEFSIHYLGNDLSPVINAAKGLRESVSLPILAKISPAFGNIPVLVKALEPYVDGFIAVNSLGPALDFDPVSIKPLMGSEMGYGWLSGKGLFPIALHIVHQLSLATDKPIIGVGGIYRGIDAIKMMMAGASAVQVCSAAIEKGHGIYAKIAQEMSDWLDDNNYASVSEIIGKYKTNSVKYEKTSPLIDPNVCIMCCKCVHTCLHKGLDASAKGIKVNENCHHCGYCPTICPVHAIRMV